jgi:hypothetical protein
MEYPMRTRISVDCSDTDGFGAGARSERRPTGPQRRRPDKYPLL